jgi:putative phosphoesterase
MIAIISDSHIPSRAPEIPKEFLEKCDDADIVVHCGDFETEEIHEELERRFDNFVAVRGNTDRVELPKYEKFNANKIRFGVNHGTGISPRGHKPTLANIADQMEVEVLLNGHTHHQEAVKENSKVLLNPGSCTGVGGGSSRPGNPKMMVVEPNTELEVEMIELKNGGFKTDTKEFKI